MTRQRPHTEYVVSTSEGHIGVTEWNADGPAVLFVHATGFHRRCWDRVIELLPGYRCVAVDILGHGISASPFPRRCRTARQLPEVLVQ